MHTKCSCFHAISVECSHLFSSECLVFQSIFDEHSIETSWMCIDLMWRAVNISSTEHIIIMPEKSETFKSLEKGDAFRTVAT